MREMRNLSDAGDEFLDPSMHDATFQGQSNCGIDVGAMQDMYGYTHENEEISYDVSWYLEASSSSRSHAYDQVQQTIASETGLDLFADCADAEDLALSVYSRDVEAEDEEAKQDQGGEVPGTEHEEEGQEGQIPSTRTSLKTQMMMKVRTMRMRKAPEAGEAEFENKKANFRPEA